MQEFISDEKDDKLTIDASPEKFVEFVAVLDSPSKENKALQRTMQMASPWDKQE